MATECPVCDMGQIWLSDCCSQDCEVCGGSGNIESPTKESEPVSKELLVSTGCQRCGCPCPVCDPEKYENCGDLPDPTTVTIPREEWERKCLDSSAWKIMYSWFNDDDCKIDCHEAYEMACAAAKVDPNPRPDAQPNAAEGK